MLRPKTNPIVPVTVTQNIHRHLEDVAIHVLDIVAFVIVHADEDFLDQVVYVVAMRLTSKEGSQGLDELDRLRALWPHLRCRPGSIVSHIGP